MKNYKKCRVIFLGLTLMGGLFMGQGTAAEMKYAMRGHIAAIDMAHSTVVIEVPIGKKSFTVGGPLDPRAVLQKGERPAELDVVLPDGPLPVERVESHHLVDAIRPHVQEAGHRALALRRNVPVRLLDHVQQRQQRGGPVGVRRRRLLEGGLELREDRVSRHLEPAVIGRAPPRSG